MQHKDKKILAIIPARGGSKGIKDKNITPVLGKPLISYVIETLKKSAHIDRIICSTDEEKIASVAKEYGAEVPFMRPKELATDTAAVYPALVHAVHELQQFDGYVPDYIVLVQATSPLTTVEQVDSTIEKVLSENADSAITALPIEHDCHPYNIRTVREDGTVGFWMEEEHYKYPSRQVKPVFYTFGNVYVSSYTTLMETGRLEGKRNYIVEIDKESALDINGPEDLAEVEMALKRRNEK
ncbi:acylneuraminate cytidylyltransferase family protein [Candidatus Kaiserbacteria bacterium CG10_big_fil_rev_8_21_14_0_10_49_17]|uniref:Acylneuraminate cytidylyltransferase family protein n=1 Tax=Candidatus Kaiserbacteria bacterium CG10_big_fil_rev_8_21_14_0_10_49_17 TaxID=1974609 RepID=A0A2M6WDX4_9BACT|nr:MAG: acylneuraminate cytidylyltransferase family protein [Candidatus Kaiserbacteria bacterium CG10_big_fil_rev_8_21_14_0_10_49_17]